MISFAPSQKNRQPGKCCDMDCSTPGQPMVVDLPDMQATLHSKGAGAENPA
jgi:4-hydroxybutyryl-CoA dehydratase/vinylacetyl-CoA-Delta-isomerase